ncbi:MAG: hypothetical protein KDB00_21630 [Planctomycetales bacterium]|nr:hypothetical protein [Planctomycetales bacterium]
MRASTALIFVSAGLGSVLLATSSYADTLELRGGIQVDGKIIRANDGGAKPHVIIEVDPELRLAIPQSRIQKTIRDDDEKIAWYKRQLELVGEDAENHYLLARACKAKGLLSQRDYHFQRAIEIDPDHAKARSTLGYIRNGNEWVLYADQQRNRGLIPTSDGWQVPEVYMREQVLDETNDAAKLWVKELTRLRSAVFKRNKHSEESMEAIKAIDDPLASLAIAEAFEKSQVKGPDTKELRMLYVKKLGAFKSAIGVQTLVKAGLFEPDPNIRSEALHQLQTYGASSAVASYLPMLSNENHKPAEVTAALRALNYFPDPELWEDYVDALVTAHQTIKPPGPGMNVGQNSLGGAGMSTGGKQEVIVNYVKNPGAVELLRQIAPDVDFRYDQNAWRKYFADQLVAAPSDLRRDL